jgi:rhodanese-related sulfurtransferase
MPKIKTNCFVAPIMLIFLCGFSLLHAQQQVVSKAYELMLKSLLDHSVPEISVDSASSIIHTRTIWLDAREKNETKVSTIKGAIAVGYDDFKISAIDSIPKNHPIIVYCSVGYRSEKISEKLIKAGYQDVHNLYGGIFEWLNQGHMLHQGDSSTLNVHGYNRAWGAWANKGKKVYPKK